MPVELREHEALGFMRSLYNKALKYEIDWYVPENNWVGVKLLTLDFQFGTNESYGRIELRDKEGKVEHDCVVTKLGDPEAFGRMTALMELAKAQMKEKERTLS